MNAVFDPEKIERELQVMERRHSPAQTRTSLFNLVVIGRSEDAGETEEKLLGRLMGKRAARIINIRMGTPGPTEVSVSARCAADRENRGVCIQEILIADGTDRAGIAPGSWSALLIRDIPVYILWRSDFRQQETLRFAREQADKFIIDGSHLVRHFGMNYEEYLMNVKIELLGQGVPTADFAWERLRPLRRFMARAFDAPEAMAALPDIVGMRFSGPDEVSLRLHALWTASSLGWNRAGGSFTSSGGSFVPCEMEDSRTGETRMLFRFADGRDMEILLSSDGVATAGFGGKEIISKALALPEDGDLLLRQVDMPGYDGLYGRALELV